jgi:prepilin-type N-terminal cleavage/methylation domain-containing protein
MKRTRAGFTLIELLVVIAILSLLVSILLPSLQKARDLARGAVCMSNLKQLGFVYQLYLEDNGQFNLYHKSGPAGTALAAMTNTWCDPTFSPLYLGGYLNYGSGADGKKSGLLDCPNLPDDVGVYVEQTNYLYNMCIPLYAPNSSKVAKPWTRVMFLDCLGNY